MKILSLLFSLTFCLNSGAIYAHIPLHEDSLKVERISVEQGLSHHSVLFILQDSLGFLWLGTGHGINRYDGYQFKTYRHDEIETAYSAWFSGMVEDRSGYFWLGTTGGLTRMDKRTGEFVFFKHKPGDPNSICSNYITVIHLSECFGHKILWVGTDNGLSRVILPDSPDGNLEIENYTHDPSNEFSLAGNHITALLESHSQGNKSLWIGTRSGLSQLILKDTLPGNQEAVFVSFKPGPGSSSLSSHSITALCESSSVNAKSPTLWVGTRAILLN